MPENALGKAWIQVPEALDIQSLKTPKNIEINWLVTENKLTNQFLDALRLESKKLDNCAIFIAAEASVVRVLKDHLNQHCSYDKSKLYASAYWNIKK